MKRQTFLQGAMVLTIAGFISKALGLVYRFPLSRLILDTGMGLYGMVYPIYTLILALSTAGVPVAISKLVSESLVEGREAEAKKIFRVSLVSFSIIGVVLSLGLFFSARSLIAIGFVRDPRAYWGLIAIAPAILIVSLLVSFRGYFQGWRMMTPTAVSQVFEQIVRVVTALLLGYVLFAKGVEFAAAGAVFGAVTGGAAGLLVLLYYFYRRRPNLESFPDIAVVASSQESRRQVDSSWNIFRRIIVISIPISLAGLVMPIMQNIDLAMVPARLVAAGFSIDRSTALYGQLSQMAATLVNMPTILTLALAASVVPVISELRAAGDHQGVEERIVTGLRVAMVLMLPAYVGFWVIAEPITIMLFANAEAGIALAAIAPAVLFLGLHQITSGVLQGLGKPLLPLYNLIAGAAMKIVLTYFLTAMPEIGVRGAAYGTVAAFFISSMLNLICIYRLQPFKIPYGNLLIKPIVSVALMAIAVYYCQLFFYRLIGSVSLSALLAICFGAGIYGLGMVLTGGLAEKDIRSLPRLGKPLADILGKLKILRGTSHE
jgi:stage V sporulation protein B